MKDPANREIYRELLTYDMYLRENLKSRPAFAAEITEEEKQDIRRFYQTEEQERHYLSAYDQYDWKQLSRMTHLEPVSYTHLEQENSHFGTSRGKQREKT